jgi:hypothetical protein
VTTKQPEALFRALQSGNLARYRVGVVGGDALKLPDGQNIPLTDLRAAHQGALPAMLKGEL